MEEEWGLEVSDPVPFETRTVSWIEFKGGELGYIVTASSRWEVTSASVMVLGVAYKVVTPTGSYWFNRLDPEDPRTFLGTAPGKHEQGGMGSFSLPTEMGPPLALTTYLAELHDIPTGSAVALVAVSHQVYPLPSRRSFPRLPRARSS